MPQCSVASVAGVAHHMRTPTGLLLHTAVTERLESPTASGMGGSWAPAGSGLAPLSLRTICSPENRSPGQTHAPVPMRSKVRDKLCPEAARPATSGDSRRQHCECGPSLEGSGLLPFLLGAPPLPSPEPGLWEQSRFNLASSNSPQIRYQEREGREK